MAKKSLQLEKVLAKAKPEIKSEIGKVKVKRVSGFKATLEFTGEELSVTVPVRFEKVTAKQVQEKLKIVHRHVSGVEVFNKPSPYKWGWYDAEGNEYPENEIKHYQILPDGREIEVKPFERTKTLKIFKLLPATSLSEFLVESQYEVWAEAETNIPALLKFAEYLSRKDAMAVCKFSFGRGFKEYYGFLYPIFREGKFLLIMALTMQRIQYEHWMPMDAETASSIQETAQTPVGILEEI